MSDDPDLEYVLIDATYIRVHQHGTGAKGGSKTGHWQIARRSDDEDRGRRRCARQFDPLFVLLPGHRHDITSFDALVAGIYCLALIGDKAFDARWLRNRLAGAHIEAVIPLREGTNGHAAHD